MEQTWRWSSHGIADWRFGAAIPMADFQQRRREAVAETVQALISMLAPFGQPYFGTVDTDVKDDAWEGQVADPGSFLQFVRQHDVFAVKINFELLCDGPSEPFKISNGGDLRLSVNEDAREYPLRLTFTLNADVYAQGNGENAELAALNGPKLEAFLKRLSESFILCEVESHAYPQANAHGLGPPAAALPSPD